MKVQRVKASDKIEATRDKVALRYGPLIYSVEGADQDINNVLKPKAYLSTEWRPDLLDGVLVIKGKWSDGSEFTAIPNYARDNRISDASESSDEDSGNRSRRRRPINSIVWLKDK
jgi:hypothetical protein